MKECGQLRHIGRKQSYRRAGNPAAPGLEK